MPNLDKNGRVHEYQLAKKGVNLYKSPVELLPDEALLTQNLIWRSGMKKRGGQVRLNTSEAVASKEVLGIHRFYYGVNKERIIAIDTKVMKDDEDNTWTDIKTGLTAGLQTHFSTWGALDKLFVANGTDTGFTWDGSTATDITATNAPGSPTQFLPYQNRILAIQGGDLQWSAAFDETATWESIANCGVRPDTILFGMIIHSVSAENEGFTSKVILAGANDMHLFWGTDLRVPFTAGNYQIYSLGMGVGCSAIRTLVHTPKGSIWLGNDSQVYLLPFNNAVPIPIGTKLQSNGTEQGIENIPSGQIETAAAVYHDGFYKLTIARTGQTTNNSQYWLDINRLQADEDGHFGPWYGPMLGRDISCYAVQSGGNDLGDLIAGEQTAKGYIYQMDANGTKSDFDASAGAAKSITLSYKTFHNPLGSLSLAKDISRIELELLQLNGTVTIAFHDITGSIKTGNSFALTAGSVTWGSFNWGSQNWDAGAVPTRQILNVTPAIQPRRLALIIGHGSSTESFELYAIRVETIEQNVEFA